MTTLWDRRVRHITRSVKPTRMRGLRGRLLKAEVRRRRGLPSRNLPVELVFEELRLRIKRSTDDPEVQDAFIRTLMKVGRPVLLSAEHLPAEIGAQIAVGWDGSIASAHALSAALPYLCTAKRVEILIVQNGALPGDGSDVAAYLALHGVTASTRILPRGNAMTAEVLLDSAAKGGFDLLVAGGYGHSQMAEAIFGGVTEHIVSHPKIPVFMMH